MRRYCSSFTQKRQILAALKTCNILVYFLHLLDEPGISSQAESGIDSESTCSLQTYFIESKEEVNKIDQATLSDSFTLRSICSVHWSCGSYHIVVVLAEYNRIAAAILSRTRKIVLYTFHPDLHTNLAVKYGSTTQRELWSQHPHSTKSFGQISGLQINLIAFRVFFTLFEHESNNTQRTFLHYIHFLNFYMFAHLPTLSAEESPYCAYSC